MSQIDSVELTIYLKNGTVLPISLSNIQTQTMKKALGLEIKRKTNTEQFSITTFTENTLLDVIIPKLSFKKEVEY